MVFNSFQKRLRVIAVLVSASVFVTLGGCAISGRSASVDSTSRMPWFGLELKERKPKNDGPAFRSVKSDDRTESRLAPVGLFRRPKSGSVVVESSDSTDPSRQKRVPLPVTEKTLVVDSVPESGMDHLDFH